MNNFYLEKEVERLKLKVKLLEFWAVLAWVGLVMLIVGRYLI